MTAAKLNLDDYEVIPSEAVVASKAVVDMWILLGRPEDPFSESGSKLMNLIISVWEDLYPQDRKDWYKARTIYQGYEKTIQEQVRQKTGRSLASYPYPIFSMMKVVFKNFDPAERENCKKMVKKWPQFRMANRV